MKNPKFSRSRGSRSHAKHGTDSLIVNAFPTTTWGQIELLRELGFNTPLPPASSLSADISPATPETELRQHLREILFEFQRYAGGEYAAQVFSPPAPGEPYFKTLRRRRLSDFPDARITGENPNGLATARTKAAVLAWQAGALRCPVVCEGRDRASGKFLPNFQNVWRYDSPKSGDVHVIDLRPASPTEEALGTVVPYTTDKDTTNEKTVYGPGQPQKLFASYQNPAVKEQCTFLREGYLAGGTWRSAWRVLRSVTDVESFSSFECFNAYDRGIFSAPLLHFILSEPQSQFPGHVSGPLIQALDASPNSLNAAWWTSMGFQYTPARLSFSATDWGDNIAHWQSFRGWHWIHRFLNPLRREAPLREALRRRTVQWLQACMDTLITAPGYANVPVRRFATSEMAAALLFRCYVNLPSSLAKVTKAALAAANNPTDLGQWQNVAQERFIQGIMKAVQSQHPARRDSCEKIYACSLKSYQQLPDYVDATDVTALSHAARSFTLPPIP
jgi:hypothetical protein